MKLLKDRRIPALSESNERRLKQAPRISATWCGDELILLDATSGRYFTLNRVGGRIWELLAKSKPAEDLVGYLRAEFDVKPEHDVTLHRDVVGMLDGMCNARLLVTEPQSTAAIPTTSKSWWRR